MRERLRALALLTAEAVRAEPWRSAGAVAVEIAGHLAPLVMVVALRGIVDGIVTGDTAAATRAALLFGGGLAAGRVLAYPVTTIEITLKERTSIRIQRRLIEITAGIASLEPHERPDYQVRMDLVRRQRDRFAEGLASFVDNIGVQTLLWGTVVLLVRLHPVLVLLPLASVAAFAAAVAKERIEDHLETSTAQRDRMAFELHRLTARPEAGMELRLFGLGDLLSRRHRELRTSVERERLRAELRKGAFQAAGDVVLYASVVGAIAFMALRASRGLATPGDVLLTVALASRVGSNVTEAIEGTANLMAMLRSVGRFLWLVEHAESSERPASAVAPATIAEGIRFEAVSFRYPGTDAWVLRDVDLHLPAGSTVAFVGDNGAGKTTMCKLLCRFYEPTQGRITIDGVDLADIDPSEWRLRMAAAFQDFARLELVLRESVGVGDLDLLDDHDAVVAAMERGGGTDVLHAHALDTQLGRRWTSGVELSGGEWQKLALGRAMMRAAPLLLILDEPTASLDADTEAALFERYAHASREAAQRTGAITLFVSHRFSTVRMADRIVVVDGGRVTEVGSHAELMARDGLYAELYELQARAYR